MGIGKLDLGGLHSELCEEGKDVLCKPYAKANATLEQNANSLLNDS